LSKNGRWIDQKVTPDILCVISEAILKHCELDLDRNFTMSSLWREPLLSELLTINFSKPELTNRSAQNEYDKLISQPLLTLAYSGILRLEKKSNRNFFTINYDAIEILQFLAVRERNSYEFLCLYLKKVLLDSGLWKDFETFLNYSELRRPSASEFMDIKDKFIKFTHDNTQIKGSFEPARIFTKVLNPLAYQLQSYGTNKGRLSATLITYSDLIYNRENFRDIGKNKNITRDQFN
jgi:hypothetical protein